MSKTTNNILENTVWENQSEEYKNNILSNLTIKEFVGTEKYRKEKKEKEMESKKNGRIFLRKYIPNAKIISSDNIKENTLVIPDNIEVIGESAFIGMNFEKVVFPKQLRVIEKSAFKNCKKLKEVIFNDNQLCIEDEAFANCQSLKNVEFRNNVYIIGERCFENCNSLEKVIFNETEENSFIEINDYAFSNCQSLQKVVLPHSLRKIEKSVFSNCRSLSEINFPEFLEYIGWASFWGCKSLKEVDLSNHYIFIDYQAFTLCGIEKFVFPKNIMVINGMTLFNTKIKELTLPETVRLLERDSLQIETLEKVYIKDNENFNKVISQIEYAGIPKNCEIVKY